MTYLEAIKNGFEPVGSSHDSNYVSHKADIASRPVCWAGGTRKGLAYVLMPNLVSYKHCFRQYLQPPRCWKREG